MQCRPSVAALRAALHCSHAPAAPCGAFHRQATLLRSWCSFAALRPTASICKWKTTENHNPRKNTTQCWNLAHRCRAACHEVGSNRSGCSQVKISSTRTLTKKAERTDWAQARELFAGTIRLFTYEEVQKPLHLKARIERVISPTCCKGRRRQGDPNGH